MKYFRAPLHALVRCGAIQWSNRHSTSTPKAPITMLSWAITFLVIALIAGVLGFTAVAGTAIEFAKIIFVIFLILFVVSLIMGRRAPRT